MGTHATREEIYEAVTDLGPQHIDPIMELKRELHTRESQLKKQQVKFAQLMATGQHSQTEAARLAGYSARSAYLQGHRLMRNDKVVCVLRLYEQIDGLINGVPKHVKRYQAKKILENEKTRDADKLQALTYLSKLDGDFSDEPSAGQNIVVNLNLGDVKGQTLEHEQSDPSHVHGGACRSLPTGEL